MRRIFNSYAFGSGPRDGCWWDQTVELPQQPKQRGDIKADVAIVGGGFTGLSAALRLARSGVDVVLLEAERIGWGASGRNGGFCCLGGSKADDAELDARYGRAARLQFRRTEKAAVSFVDAFVTDHAIDVDRHSNGETALAHRPKDMAALRAYADRAEENFGVEVDVIEKNDLSLHGMGGGGPFFGAATMPVGFGLNPRKYIAGLLQVALSAGVTVCEKSPVTSIKRSGSGHRLTCDSGQVTADQVVVATNGYSSEDIPAWLAGRYMPSQSTVLVTRPLELHELDAQGWTSHQMSYDTRNLVHYFRLMPDRRFLFGMRGGLRTGARAEADARVNTRRDFERMFPAWRQVESNHTWSGMVNLARKKLPYVGAIPGSPGVWTAMCYHGNGVAMGSYSGHLIAGFTLGQDDGACPEIMQRPLARFPFGRARRALMPLLYAKLMAEDRF